MRLLWVFRIPLSWHKRGKTDQNPRNPSLEPYVLNLTCMYIASEGSVVKLVTVLIISKMRHTLILLYIWLSKAEGSNQMKWLGHSPQPKGRKERQSKYIYMNVAILTFNLLKNRLQAACSPGSTGWMPLILNLFFSDYQSVFWLLLLFVCLNSCFIFLRQFLFLNLDFGDTNQTLLTNISIFATIWFYRQETTMMS